VRREARSVPLLTVVALGDSLTYSRRNTPGARYCELLERELSSRLAGAAEVVVINSGVGGDTAQGGLARFDRDVAAHQPDLVLVEFAANDVIRREPEWFEDNLDKLTAAIADGTGARIVLSTGPYLVDRQNDYGEEFAEAGGLDNYMLTEMSARIRKVAGCRGAPVLDLHRVFADAIAGSEGARYINPTDGIHWTDEGNRLAAAAMADVAAPLLRELAETRTDPQGGVAGPEPVLIPEPKLLERTGGSVLAIEAASLGKAPEAAAGELARFAGALGELGIACGESGYSVVLRQTEAKGFLPEDTAVSAREEAYRLAIRPGGASLEAEGLQGFRNALATLAQYVAQLVEKGRLPAVAITDWPSMAYRGAFMEDKWGTDLMTLEDWKGVVDYLAARKMNVMGVGLYGCWCVQYDGEVTEFLMTPVPGHSEIKKGWTCRWYSPASAEWKELSYLPRMFEGDFFGDLVAYGRERGVRVVPFVNSLGHNTLIPRMIPEISSKDASGKPTGYGYCLSNPATWEFITSFYGDIVDRQLLPNGADVFHIQMDEVYPCAGVDPTDPKRVVDPDCKCPECAARPVEERIQDYVIKLAKFLVSRGMKHVVIWNDQLTRHMDLVDSAFADRLRAEGIYDNVVLHWWWYSKDYIHDKVHPRIGQGLRGWVAPMTCYFNWAYYRPNHQNVANMLAMGHAEDAEGAVSYSVFDAACGFDFALLADYAWNPRGAGPLRSELANFAVLDAGPWAGELAEAIRALEISAESGPVSNVCYYGYSYPSADQPYPRRYPAEALENLSAGDERDPGMRSALEAMRGWAKRARMNIERIPDEDRSDAASNLLAEAARFEGLAECFRGLQRVRQECEVLAEGERNGLEAPDFSARVACQLTADLAQSFAAHMALVERNKPDYMVPSCMRDLSVMYEFLLQLEGDLAQAADGKRKWSDVRWFVQGCVAQRGR